MSDGQEQSCPKGPGMTPLLASHKEAGGGMGRRVAIDAAVSGSGRDGLNLCEGAGEGTAALARRARPSSALPLGGLQYL